MAKWRGYSGRYVLRGSRLVPAAAADLRERDNVRILHRLATACHPSQVGEFNRRFGDMGVRYLPDGKVVYKDRRSMLRVLKARGMFMQDEVRG